MPDPDTFGQLSVIDLQARVQVGGFEITSDVSQARAALARPADIEDDHILAWGHLTPAEAKSVIDGERDEADRADLWQLLCELLQPEASHAITLFYRRRRGQ